MLKTLSKNELVFFGELHNNPIAHWLEYEVLHDLHQNQELVLGAEMLEADNQEALTSYVQQKIDQKALDTLSRLWPNYSTDYAPLVDFAKENQLVFIATNVPRRYAKIVYRQGFKGLDTLSTQDKSWIAPLPIAFDSSIVTYQNILKMMGNHGTMNLVKAQALKDATMAHFILKHLQSNAIFLHFNGAFHSDYKEGIIWHIYQQNKDVKISSISTVSQKDISKLEEEYLGKADFIICVDSDMTKTY